MIRHPLIACFVLLFAAPLQGEEPKELEKIRAQYQKIGPRPSEADRQRYVAELAALRERFADEALRARHAEPPREENTDWEAVDAEILRHPAPKDSDSKALSALLIGKWKSPRHEYVYKEDGTWSMLPDDGDSTNGRWRIEGNRYLDLDNPPPSRELTIILVSEKYFIRTDGKVVFYEIRLHGPDA